MSEATISHSGMRVTASRRSARCHDLPSIQRPKSPGTLRGRARPTFTFHGRKEARMRPLQAMGIAGDVFPNFEEERKKRRQQSPPRREYRPGVVWGVPLEALETRRLFASVSLSGTTLTVTGDSDGTGEDI